MSTATEREVAAQQAGGGPPPPADPPGGGPGAQVAAVAALLATQQAASAAASAPVAAIAGAAATALRRALQAILAGFDRFLHDHRESVRVHVIELLGSGPTDEERREIIAEELDRERIFAAKSRERLARDLPTALATRGRRERRAAVETLMERERRFARQREEAIIERAAAHRDRFATKRRSPTGAYWHLNPALDNCARCRAMAGKVWPWSVLDVIHPTLHPHCACKLYSVQEARRRGWITASTTPGRFDDLPRSGILEAEPVPDDWLDDLDLLEAAYRERFGKGHSKGGQFKPRRGAVPGRPTRPNIRAGRRTIRPILPTAPAGAGTPERPRRNLPDVAPDDRYELRDRGDGHVVVWDRHTGAPDSVWRPGVDDETILADIRDLNEQHRATRDQPAPTPPGPEAPALEDYLAVVSSKRPTEPGELAPGIHFDPTLTRSQTRDGELHLPPGFWGQTKAVREKVVLRHLGGQLADGLSDAEKKRLQEQAPHLKSRKAIVDTYFAVNTASRDRMADLHPDAARLVAQAAHEHGVPLHPDAHALITRPATSETPEPEHPAHALAARINGLRGHEAVDLLREAGYEHPVTINGGTGGVFRNHEQRTEIRVPTITNGAELTGATATVHDQASAPELAELRGKLLREDMYPWMTERGFSPAPRFAGDWVEWVHPDGRGLAVNFGTYGPMDREAAVADVVSFRATADEVRDARVELIRADPLHNIQAGEDLDVVERALGRAKFRKFSEDDAGDGERDVDFQRIRLGEGEEWLRVVHRDGVVVRAGRPGENAGEVVTQEEYEAWQARAKAADEERRRKREEAERQKANEAFADIRADLEAGRRPKLEGRPLNATALFLRDDLGWQIVTARRTKIDGVGGGVLYTVRSPEGDTLTFKGTNVVAKVTAYKKAPRIDRVRITGRAPMSWSEFEGDALARADEQAEKYDAVASISTILHGSKRDHAAHREWNGTVVLGREIKPSIDRYLAKRAAGEQTTDQERLDFYSAIQTVQHELNHGVTAPGAERKPSMDASHYTGPGKGWEESLTEESAHLETVDWLRSYGMTEVLEAVKRNPTDQRVRGTYRQYRDSLRKILDDAEVPQDERADLIRRMKFQMTPFQRLEYIGERLQARGHVRRDYRTGRDMTPDREAYYRMTTAPERWTAAFTGPQWEPIVRPDLSDIDAELTVGIGRGRTVKVSAQVTETASTARGQVVEILGDMVRVQWDDGLLLWVQSSRLH